MIANFFTSHLGEIIAFFSGGTILSLFTAKYTVKTAEANAMKEWQGVYQETIKDLREDKDLLKKEINELRIIVTSHTVEISELRSNECIVTECAFRVQRPRKINIPNETN